MQTAEIKTSSSAQNQLQMKRQPFFNKEGQGNFFSRSNQNTSSFFSPSTIQPKLTIGQPNDKYEVEADAMADRVVQRLSDSSNQNTSKSTTNPGIQRKCSSCEEEEKLQKKEDDFSQSGIEVQRKPIFESNAEQPDADIQSKALTTPIIQANCSSCEQEEKLQKKEEEELPDSELSLQRKSADVPSENTPDLESRLSSTKGGGSSLPSDIQSSMGSEFGTDFSNVRVHTGSEAVQMSQDIGAQAFTHGSDIYFNQGKYDTNSSSGKHLLAHELTHTVQQTIGIDSKIQRLEDLSERPTMACEEATTGAPPIAVDSTFATSVTTLSPAQKAKIATFVLSWQASEGMDTLRIDGYASTSGADKLNWRLSCDRALSVGNELIINGVPNNLFEIFAQGETSEFGAKRNNQRADIGIIPAKTELKSETTPQPDDRIKSTKPRFKKLDKTLSTTKACNFFVYDGTEKTKLGNLWRVTAKARALASKGGYAIDSSHTIEYMLKRILRKYKNEGCGCIEEIQFWSHGSSGNAMYISETTDEITAADFNIPELNKFTKFPDHLVPPINFEENREKWFSNLSWRQQLLVELREAICKSGAEVYYRSCSAFQGSLGKEFAKRSATFWRSKIIGHTKIIGLTQPGKKFLNPGQEPYWSESEGSNPKMKFRTQSPKKTETKKQEKKASSESDKEIQRKPLFENNTEQPDADIQSKPLTTKVLQAKCDSCEQEEKLQKKEEVELSGNEPALQRMAADVPSENTSNLEDRLSSSKGGGSSLSTGIQSSMGSEFGADFSNVRVHTGSEATQMNQEIGAQAFTHGSDIYFNQGKYDTNSNSGNHLLAHELTHTVQQGSSNKMINKVDDESNEEASANVENARTKALAIKEALHGSLWGEDEQTALNQIRGQSVTMLSNIRSIYKDVAHKNLEIDLRDYLNNTEFKEGLEILYPALPLIDRIKIYANHSEMSWIMIGMVANMVVPGANTLSLLAVPTDNESAIMRELAAASVNEISRANSSEIKSLLRSVLDDDDYFKAQKIFAQGNINKIYEAVKERIRNAAGFWDDNENAVYNAIFDLPRSKRIGLWNNNRSIFNFLGENEKKSIGILCTGSEVEALKERLRLATDVLGTYDEDVAFVMAQVARIIQTERITRAMLQSGVNADGSPLSENQRISLQATLDGLEDIQETFLNTRRNQFEEYQEDSFLGMLYHDLSEEEFQNYASQLGVSQFERSKQQILDALGTFDDDENAVYEAFNSVTGTINMSSEQLSGLPVDERRILQQEADEQERQRLFRDFDVQFTIRVRMGFTESELTTLDAFLSVDQQGIAMHRLEDAYRGMDTDEEGVFQVLLEMPAQDRQQLYSAYTEGNSPAILLEILGSNSWLTEQERAITLSILRDGRIPTTQAINWSLGVWGDGTEEEFLNTIFQNLSAEDTRKYRLGYYWFKRVEEGNFNVPNDIAANAYNEFSSLYTRMRAELDPEEIQIALDNLLGTPSRSELQSEEGMRIAAEIMRYRIQEKGDVREGDIVSSAIMDSVSDTGQVSDQAESRFMSVYNLAMEDDELLPAELSSLVGFNRTFEETYQEYNNSIDQVTSIAATVASVAAAIVATILTKGAAAPTISAALKVGAASAVTRVAASEMIGGSHYQASSTEGMRDALVGFVEGGTIVLGAGLSNAFMRSMGLGGNALAGELTGAVLRSSNAALSRAGQAFVREGIRGTIDGIISGAVGEVVLTAMDERVWRQTIWNILADFGASLIRGIGIGGVTGFVTGGTIDALITFVGATRLQGLVRQLEVAGLDAARLDNLSIDGIRLIGNVENALRSGNINDAADAFESLSEHLTRSELRSLQQQLTHHHGIGGDDLETLTNRIDNVLNPEGSVGAKINDAINRGDVQAYIEALREEVVEEGSFYVGRSWDYDAFSGRPGRIWRAGDPIDMPSVRGEYPTYRTARGRYWRNRAYYELQARRQGRVVHDPLDTMDPMRILDDNELQVIIDTPTADIRSPEVPQGSALRIGRARREVMELEHHGVPQRVRRWLEQIKYSKQQARRLAGVSSPGSLEEMTPLEHAFYDEMANRYPSRADASGRHFRYSYLGDLRVERPLSRMDEQTIRQIVNDLNNNNLDLDISLSPELYDALQIEINLRPNLNDLFLP